jgi:tRNA 2-thiouridine synthesizing protein A
MDEQTQSLDLRGLKCPLPALFARRALARAMPGTTIEVIVDDPLAPIDVPHMCAQEGFDVVSTAREGATTSMLLRKPSRT